MDMQGLEFRWLSLVNALNKSNEGSLNSATNAKQHFNILAEKYAEPVRHYHTLAHIYACLQHFDSIVASISKPVEIELAIWFHDAIYNPTSQTNEEDSALFARQFLTSIDCRTETIEAVAQHIVATKHPAEPNSQDQAFLLDIDLAILGADSALYEKYEKWIRAEYQHVPIPLYRTGRKSLLHSFMAPSRIYRTDHFHALLEEQARANLAWAIQQL